LNNVVEQDHRAIKCFTWPMPGFKDFDSARVIPRGVEVMHHDQESEDEVRQRNAASCRQPFSLSRFISNP
jgi:putative transposase